MLEFLEKFGVNTGWILAVVGGVMLLLLLVTLEIDLTRMFGFAAALLPTAVLFVSFYLFFEAWMTYVRFDYDQKQGRVTLEIKLPQDVLKSPEAMELILVQLHQTAAPDNHIQTYWDGKHPPVTSLEIVSRGGEVRFYINVPRKKFKNITEAAFYSQYPGVEVTELPVDYTAEIPWDPSRFSYFSIHFGLKKADAYPIKTYQDYGLSGGEHGEQQIDPIAAFIDGLANIGPGEYYWVQILIDANRKVSFKEGSLGKEADWTEAARDEIKKLLENAEKKRQKDSGLTGVMLLTEGEKQAISAIERSLSKNAFNTAIRGMYIAKNEAYLPGERIGALITTWRGYDDVNRNAIGVRWRTDFDWNWWQDPSGRKKQAMKEEELHLYKKRAYIPFSSSHADTKKVMTTEELATIFHLPGKVVGTPTLTRIPSTRGEAPSNLPTIS